METITFPCSLSVVKQVSKRRDRSKLGPSAIDFLFSMSLIPLLCRPDHIVPLRQGMNIGSIATLMYNINLMNNIEDRIWQYRETGQPYVTDNLRAHLPHKAIFKPLCSISLLSYTSFGVASN
jgi:hypothetical protein